MPSDSATPLVVFVLFNRTKLLDVTGPLQVFNDAKTPSGAPAYRTLLVSECGGPVVTDTGIALSTRRLTECNDVEIDTLLVSGGDAALQVAQTGALCDWLIEQSRHVRRLGSICLGAFILAGCGLLDGRPATTHWEYCSQLAARFSMVEVRSDPIFVRADHIWTSAGVTAGIDMALAMVEQDLGHTAALALARDLVLFLKRPGGQSQFSIELRWQAHDCAGRFDGLHKWMRDNLATDLSVPALASFMAMSPRNFARVYTKTTGQSPGRGVEALRVEAARRLLESSTFSVQQIAHRVGFGDDERLRRAFVKALAVAPYDYRRRFSSQLQPE